MPLPVPAPCWTRTSWPAAESACTAAGIMPIRYSLSLTSLGTPMRTSGSLPAATASVSQSARSRGRRVVRLGGGTRLPALVGLHVDPALEEGALGDHHPRRGDVSLDA